MPQSTRHTRKLSGDFIETDVRKHLKKASDALATLNTSTKSQIQDAPALYGQLLVAKLRKLSHRSQIVLQNKIDNLIFEAELNEVDNSYTAVTRSVTNISSNYFSTVPTPSLSNS